jgi:hypothetical protein
MQTHTHTQGPWKAEGWENLVVNSADGHTMTLAAGGKDACLDELRANARLIAAAPDMLSELHALRVQLEAQSAGYTALEIWPHVRAELIRRVSMTISKAEGKA